MWILGLGLEPHTYRQVVVVAVVVERSLFGTGSPMLRREDTALLSFLYIH